MRLRDALGRRVRRIRPRGGGSPGGCRDSSIGAKSGGGGGDVSGTRLVEYGLDPPGAGELLAGGGAHLEVEVLDDPDEVRPRDGVVRALLLEVAHREGCACEGTERRGGGSVRPGSKWLIVRAVRVLSESCTTASLYPNATPQSARVSLRVIQRPLVAPPYSCVRNSARDGAAATDGSDGGGKSAA